jgi:hypothetical protein
MLENLNLTALILQSQRANVLGTKTSTAFPCETVLFGLHCSLQAAALCNEALHSVLVVC